MESSRILHILDIIFQQILAVFVILVFWEVWKSYDLTNIGTWHVLLCVSGVALYVAEGVQVFRKESIYFVTSPRDDRVLPHGIIMGLGLLNVIIGISLKIKQKVDASSNHFETTHAILGLVAWILLTINVIGGILSAKMDRTIRQRRIIKICHIILGITAYIVGAFALAYGLNYLVAVRGRNALIILMSLYIVYSLKGPIMSLIDNFR